MVGSISVTAISNCGHCPSAAFSCGISPLNFRRMVSERIQDGTQWVLARAFRKSRADLRAATATLRAAGDRARRAGGGDGARIGGAAPAGGGAARPALRGRGRQGRLRRHRRQLRTCGRADGVHTRACARAQLPAAMASAAPRRADARRDPLPDLFPVCALPRTRLRAHPQRPSSARVRPPSSSSSLLGEVTVRP